ncbi:MAG: hypothetical protein AAF567_21360 [Actinomycetota bacterium]
MTDEPILEPGRAPEHADDFWATLEHHMSADAAPTTNDATTKNATTNNTTTTNNATAGEVSTTAELPTVAVGSAPRRWRLVPVAAAAAVLTIAGVAMLLARGGDDATEVVSGDVAAVPAQGATASGSGDGVDADVIPPIPTAAPTPISLPEAASGDTTGDTASGSVGSLPTYELAAGNDDTTVHLPPTPFPDGTRILGTWEEAELTWFGLRDASMSCHDARYGEIVFVTQAGGVLDLADPQPRFSGAISNLAMTADGTLMAWLAECDGQLELYVSRGAPLAGQRRDIRLAWVGRGSDTAALVEWDQNVVTLSSFDDQGEPFFVEVEVGGLEPAAPAAFGVHGTGVDEEVASAVGLAPVVAATPDGSRTWWNGAAAGVGSCDGVTLLTRSGSGPLGAPFGELVDPTLVADLGAVVAFDVEPNSGRVAFADACPGRETSRVFVGRLDGSGLIGEVRVIDLSLFTAGDVEFLSWVDSSQLRIHTDERATIGTPLVMHYLFDSADSNLGVIQIG